MQRVDVVCPAARLELKLGASLRVRTHAGHVRLRCSRHGGRPYDNARSRERFAIEQQAYWKFPAGPKRKGISVRYDL